MSFPSKFGGKCKTCGTSWKAGTPIVKINDGQPGAYWCANAACGQGGEPAPAPAPAPTPAPAAKPASNGTTPPAHAAIPGETSEQYFARVQAEIKAANFKSCLNAETTKKVRESVLCLASIEREVEATLKAAGDPAPVAQKVGMYTKIIFDQMNA